MCVISHVRGVPNNILRISLTAFQCEWCAEDSLTARISPLPIMRLSLVAGGWAAALATGADRATTKMEKLSCRRDQDDEVIPTTGEFLDSEDPRGRPGEARSGPERR